MTLTELTHVSRSIRLRIGQLKFLAMVALCKRPVDCIFFFTSPVDCLSGDIHNISPKVG